VGKSPVVLMSLVPFVLLCFGPLLLFLALFVPGVVATAFLAPEGQLFFLLAVLAIVYPLLVIRIGYQHCLKSVSWFSVGLKLYVYWLLVLAPVVFLLLYALGSASMATDGTMVHKERLSVYLAQTAVLLFIGHVLLVPWVFLSTALARRSSRKRLAKAT